MADLDIRDITHVSDSIKIGDGTDFLAITAAGAITVDSITNDVTVYAVDLDIRDLTAASDSVESWTHDGTGTAITSTKIFWLLIQIPLFLLVILYLLQQQHKLYEDFLFFLCIFLTCIDLFYKHTLVKQIDH